MGFSLKTQQNWPFYALSRNGTDLMQLFLTMNITGADTGSMRQSVHTKTGTPERQTGGLGQGITVQKMQLCCDLRFGKQAGQDSLGAYDATTGVRVVSLYSNKLFNQSLIWFCEY